jgi:hypothetical protein
MSNMRSMKHRWMSDVEDPERLYAAAVMTLFERYVALWRQIESEGVRLLYDGLIFAHGIEGLFIHEGRCEPTRPEIWISRPTYKQPRNQPLDVHGDGTPAPIEKELLTLAHEYGHFLSWKGRATDGRWDAYRAAALRRDDIAVGAGPDGVRVAWSAAMSEADKTLILDEETLAWKLGRPSIPDELHAEYDEKTRLSLHFYRYRMGFDPLWPEDGPVPDATQP